MHFTWNTLKTFGREVAIMMYSVKKKVTGVIRTFLVKKNVGLT